MKLKVTVTQETTFEVPDSDLQRIYGTTDPKECARMEATNPAACLIAAAKECGQKIHTTCRVEPV
jgi:hypothetical protein